MATKKTTSKYSQFTGSYAGLAQLAEEADRATKSAADAQYIATALPGALRESFRKNADPELDKAIVTKQNEVLGGAIVGLDKYQDIANPFTRRALAEKYQSGLSIGLGSLTSERDRRQGKLEEYITKWTGMYGADAVRKNQLASAANDAFNRGMTMADKVESQRRWEIEQANKGGLKVDDKSLFREYLSSELAGSVGKDGKVDPVKYRQLRDEAFSRYGMTKSDFDAQFGSGLGEHEYKGLGITTKEEPTTTPKQDFENRKFSEMNSAKESESEAANGELYWKNGRIYRKVKWGSDELVYEP